MDYRILTDPADLHSTDFIEIHAGRYAGEHWQPGSLFLRPECFALTEGVVAKHFPQYDAYGPNEVPKAIGLRIVSEWRSVAAELPSLAIEPTRQALNLNAVHCRIPEIEFFSHCEEIAWLLKALANELEKFYSHDEWISILGL